MAKKAMILCGGWDGHQPQLVSARFKKYLESEGFDVKIEESVQVIKDKDALAELDLFVPVWTMCGDNLGYGFFEPLIEAIGGG
ncbi:MAG: hypothetical protein LBU66_04455, partial [Treponema sp.]|nr:hypothetical protein [Treponema sp.]